MGKHTLAVVGARVLVQNVHLSVPSPKQHLSVARSVSVGNCRTHWLFCVGEGVGPPRIRLGVPKVGDAVGGRRVSGRCSWAHENVQPVFFVRPLQKNGVRLKIDVPQPFVQGAPRDFFRHSLGGDHHVYSPATPEEEEPPAWVFGPRSPEGHPAPG